MFNIDEQKINISCPKCSFENSVTLKQIGNQESIICGGCRCSIKLMDEDGSIHKTTKTIKEEVDKLRRLSKDIKINIKI